MQKVITINLNGHACQLDEPGYEALHEYLASAERALAGNPDRAEIMADLEQAIADKCQRFLGAHKSVVAAGEVEQIVREMGPIETEAAADDKASTGAGATTGAPRTPPPPRRLYRVPAGSMIAGVCNGIAAYFGVDVTLIRLAFVIVAVLTKGVGVLFYVVMMFIVPEANTAEERAVAGGATMNAKDIIDRAKQHYTDGTKAWRRQWRQQQRQWRRYGWPAAAPVAYTPPTSMMVLMPIFSIAHLALFLTMMAMLISLVNTGTILDWRLPEDVPLWAGVLILLVGYQIVVSPIRAAHHWPWPRLHAHAPWFTFWNAVVWMIGLAIAVWIASDHLPEIREFLQRLPDVTRDFGIAMRDLFER